MEVSQQQFAEAYNKLPYPIRDFLAGPELGQIVQDIAARYGLHVDAMGTFEQIILHMMLGFETPMEFLDELRRAGIAEGNVYAITDELNAKIFKPLQQRVREQGAEYHERTEAEIEAEVGSAEPQTITPPASTPVAPVPQPAAPQPIPVAPAAVRPTPPPLQPSYGTSVQPVPQPQAAPVPPPQVPSAAFTAPASPQPAPIVAQPPPVPRPLQQPPAPPPISTPVIGTPSYKASPASPQPAPEPHTYYPAGAMPPAPPTQTAPSDRPLSTGARTMANDMQTARKEPAPVSSRPAFVPAGWNPPQVPGAAPQSWAPPTPYQAAHQSGAPAVTPPVPQERPPIVAAPSISAESQPPAAPQAAPLADAMRQFGVDPYREPIE